MRTRTKLMLLLAIVAGLSLALWRILERQPQNSSEPAPNAERLSPREDVDARAGSTRTASDRPSADTSLAERDEIEREQLLRFLEDTSVIGRVTNTLGEGLSEARVIALNLLDWGSIARDADPQLWSFGAFDFSDELRNLYRRFAQRAESLPATTTNLDGMYAFPELESGHYRILVSHTESLPSIDHWIDVNGGPSVRCDVILSTGSNISGRVIDDHGSPIAHARIRGMPSDLRSLSGDEKKEWFLANWLEGRFLVEATCVESGDDGSFRLSSLWPASYDLTIGKNRFVKAQMVDVPAGLADLEVVLSLGLSLKGAVRNRRGEMVPGANVILEIRSEEKPIPVPLGRPNIATVTRDLDLEDTHTWETESDAHGRFEFDFLAPASYHFSVRTREYPPIDEEIYVEEGVNDLGMLTFDDPRIVGGVIRASNGAPLPDARVWVERTPIDGVACWGGRDLVPPAIVEVRSDREGRFRMDKLPDGVFTIRASSEAYLEGLLTNIQSGREDIEILLKEGSVIEGTVRDALSFEPIAAARVTLTTGLRGNDESEKTVLSDEQGAFILHGVSSSNANLGLRVSHADYPTSEHIRLKSSSLANVTLELHPGDRISGWVFDARRQPIASAVVRCEFFGSRKSSLLRRMSGSSGLTRTGDDGAFAMTLPSLLRQDYMGFELVATHPDFGMGRLAHLDRLDEEKGWADVVIMMDPLSSITGSVIDSLGTPVAGAVIDATIVDEDGNEGMQQTGFSTGDGTYTIHHLEPGTFRVKVRALGFAPSIVESLEVGEAPCVQDFKLDLGLGMSGTVIDTLKNGVGGAEVIALETSEIDQKIDHGTAPTRWLRRAYLSGLSLRRADDQGHYSFSNLPNRPLTLVARAPGYEPSQLIVASPGGLVEPLVLTRLARLSGKVFDSQSSVAISHFRVQFRRIDPTLSENEMSSYDNFPPREYSNTGGEFQVIGLPPGSYFVGVMASGYVVDGGVVVLHPGEETTIAFRLKLGKVLEGVVKDGETGRGVPGARIKCYPKDPEGWERRVSASLPNVTTEEDGTFQMGGLREGDYVVRAWHNDFLFEKGSREIAITREPAVSLEFTTIRGGKLKGRVGNLSTRKGFNSHLRLKPAQSEGIEQGVTIPHRSDDYESGILRSGAYEVYLNETLLGPDVDPKATAFTAEDTVERETFLGTVEIRPGETTVFNSEVPLEPNG